jgi:hypothetical protein
VTEDNSQSLRSYLDELLDTIDAQLREAYSDVLKREVEMRLCRACRARFDGPMPSGFAPPEEAAKTLMRKAAGTKRSIPSAEIWRIQPELKSRLQELYLSFIRELLGPHQALVPTIEATMVVGATAAEIHRAMLWWKFTTDVHFIDRIKESIEPTGQTFEVFRREFIDTCIKDNVSTQDEALKLLDRQVRAYAAKHYH